MLAERLRDIAQEGTSDKRRQLLRELTDMFFEDGEGRSDTERELFGEVATKITGDMPIEDRSAFAERIADEGAAPRQLVVTLGNDDIAVARPIIERSTVLTDDDICAIVEKRGEEHRIAVTARPAISRSVSDALVKHGGEAVHTRLAEHRQADISPEARGALRPAAPARPAAPPPQTDFSAALVAQEVTKRIKLGKSTLDVEFRHMTARDMTQIIGHVLASFTQVKAEIAVRTVATGRPEALLMLMRAAGASFEAFSLVMGMQCRLRRRPEPDYEALRLQFDAADLASAQRVIRFLNLRQTMELQGAA